MANQISGPPNNYDFGLGFDYAVWTANTKITLTNVPWNNDYRDVVAFGSTNDLNDYIDRSISQNVVITNSVYAKVSEPIVIDAPFNIVNKFNYVRVYNPAQPVMGRDDAKYFYYFITDVVYTAPNSTTIVVQLDVFQTYIRQVQFGRCYIERGHLGIANERNYQNYGRDFLTVPEGLDTGSQYITVDRYNNDLMSIRWNNTVNALGRRLGYSILVCSTIDLSANPGTVQAPNLRSARGGLSFGVPSGASFYIFKTVNDFAGFMARYSQYPWITQGIISVTIIPDVQRYYGTSATVLGARLAFGGYRAPANAPGVLGNVSLVPINSDFRSTPNISNYIPPRYRHLKKLTTFPYMAVRLSSNTGQHVILQPEYWNSGSGELREVAALMPPNSRVSLYPIRYGTNQVLNENSGYRVAGQGLDYAVSINGFPTLPIVNNNSVLYMAQNAHSISFGYQSANWSQQRALRGNEVSYDQATMGMNAALDQSNISAMTDSNSTGISNQLAQDSAVFNAIGGTLSGAGMGAFAGPAGAIAGGVGGIGSGVMGMMSTGMQVGASNAQLANRLSTLSQSTGVSNALAGGLRDTNKSLADWASKGDYENAIAGLNAKTQDSLMSPPSLSGQQGGELLNLMADEVSFRIEILMPDQATIQSIGEYWLRYGYAIQRFSFIPDSLMVMNKFTYWKMKETYIRAGNVPETVKQSLRGLFEKGVTVWANPDDIGLIDPADNKPLPGVLIETHTPPASEPEPPINPPTVIKKRKTKVIVYSTIDSNPATPGSLWALAGSSPGTDANFIETRDPQRAESWLEWFNADNPVGVTEVEFAEYRNLYKSPVGTQEIPPAVE